jgi:hypothetical protein
LTGRTFAILPHEHPNGSDSSYSSQAGHGSEEPHAVPQ